MREFAANLFRDEGAIRITDHATGALVLTIRFKGEGAEEWAPDYEFEDEGMEVSA